MEHGVLTSSASRIFVFIFSFVIGVLVSSFFFIPPLVSLLILLIGTAVLIAEKIYKNEIAGEVLLLSLALFAFSLGALRYSVKDFHEVAVPAETGVVVSEPEARENTTRFVLLADNGEKVLVSAPLYASVEYGDRIRASGKLERPGVIESEDGGRPFDYEAYLAKDGIYHTLSFAAIEILGRGYGNPVKATLFKIKRSFVEHAQKILPEPQAGFLAGLLVAGRGTLPQDILEEFRRAGVIHIVVLSGFNITLIADFMRRVFGALFLFLRWTRFAQAPALTAIAGVALFVVMTGGEATVVRSALMALTVIVAGLLGRTYSAPRALFAAGFLMLLHNPKILVFDPSFQLSFLATLGLIYLMPPIEKFFHFMTTRFQLRGILSQTIATQTAVLPLLIYSMGDVSLVSLPANILTLVVVPWTMFLGFIAVLFSYLSIVVAWPVALITHLLLSWILFVSHFLGSLSFASVKIPPFPFGVVFLLYILLIFTITWSRLRKFL